MTGKEAKERLEKQYKRQNAFIKEKYDRISATVPLGTIDRIKALGLKTNGLVKELLLAELDRLEAEAARMSQNAEIDMKKKEVKENTPTEEKNENKANNKSQDARTEADKMAELQKLIDEKRAAEQRKKEEKESEKDRKEQEEFEEVINNLERIRNGKELPEDEGKEIKRKETLARPARPF